MARQLPTQTLKYTLIFANVIADSVLPTQPGVLPRLEETLLSSGLANEAGRAQAASL